MRDYIRNILGRAVERYLFDKKVQLPEVRYDIERPRESQFGDWSTNVGFVFSRLIGSSPRTISEDIMDRIEDEEGCIERMAVAGPGFLNFHLCPSTWLKALNEVERKGNNYGYLNVGGGKAVLVEFVSANPTGPLHIGHGRGAVVGDAIASLMVRAGYETTREYYINDFGNQMDLLAHSVSHRMKEIGGERDVFPDDYYKGDYIKEIAEGMIKADRDSLFKKVSPDDMDGIVKQAAEYILKMIKDDLYTLGVGFDSWFKESDLHKKGLVEQSIGELREMGYIREEDNALWFTSAKVDDDKDRVVRKKDGIYTYFASDIAYHRSKIMRGYQRLINVWGSDHHGYVPRMRAVVDILGDDKLNLDMVLVQMVNLIVGGKPVSMSTRAGEYIPLREVLEDVGRDVTRFFLLMRRSDSHLDFDLDIARKSSYENPVYYIQYAHARICSIIKEAEKRGIKLPRFDDVDISLLNTKDEVDIAKEIVNYPVVIEESAATLEPHKIAFFLIELAGRFHKYYNHNRVISHNLEDKEELHRTKARLLLVRLLLQVLRCGIDVLGISAPEKM